MHWQNFLIGNGCFALACLLRVWNKWAWDKTYWNYYGRNAINWIWVVALILCGFGFILSAIPDKI